MESHIVKTVKGTSKFLCEQNMYKKFMKLAMVILIVVIFSLVANPVYAVYETLSLKTSHKSIPEGEKFTLSGELKDRNLKPIRSAEITIWEKDSSNQKFLGTTTTNSLGKFQITIISAKWDGTQKDVELFASAGTYSAKSPTITMYIEEQKPFIPIKNTYHDTQLSLKLTDGDNQGYIKVKPLLTYGSGKPLTTHDVSIFVDGNYVTTVTSNQWSSNIYTGFDSHTIKASVAEMTSSNDDSIKYRSSSDVENYFVKPDIPPIPDPTSNRPPLSKDTDFPIGYVIVGIIIIAAAVGIGIKFSRKKNTPAIKPTPSPISPTSNVTQFWVCPACGNDTKEYLGRTYCHNCNRYL